MVMAIICKDIWEPIASATIMKRRWPNAKVPIWWIALKKKKNNK
jgi:hypothetical protein